MKKELRKENINMEEIVAALLTIAWASTKGREISQTEAYNVYKNMIEKVENEEQRFLELKIYSFFGIENILGDFLQQGKPFLS